MAKDTNLVNFMGDMMGGLIDTATSLIMPLIRSMGGMISSILDRLVGTVLG